VEEHAARRSRRVARLGSVRGVVMVGILRWKIVSPDSLAFKE
jgi:hypothetical protein